MSNFLVLGLGNLLMNDDAAGLHAVYALQERYPNRENFQIIDGGTLGLDLLGYVAWADKLLLLDAIDIKNDQFDIGGPGQNILHARSVLHHGVTELGEFGADAVPIQILPLDAHRAIGNVHLDGLDIGEVAQARLDVAGTATAFDVLCL